MDEKDKERQNRDSQDRAKKQAGSQGEGTRKVSIPGLHKIEFHNRVYPRTTLLENFSKCLPPGGSNFLRLLGIPGFCHQMPPPVTRVTKVQVVSSQYLLQKFLFVQRPSPKPGLTRQFQPACHSLPEDSKNDCVSLSSSRITSSTLWSINTVAWDRYGGGAITKTRRGNESTCHSTHQPNSPGSQEMDYFLIRRRPKQPFHHCLPRRACMRKRQRRRNRLTHQVFCLDDGEP